MRFKKFLFLIALLALIISPLASAQITLTKISENIRYLIYVIIAIFVFSILYVVISILTLKSIIRSSNENKWKFKWVLIVVFLNVLGILLYLIFGKRKKIPEGKQAEETRDRLLEEAPEKTIADLETKSIISSQETVQPTIAEKKTEILQELKPVIDYIKETRAKGFSDEQIKDALRKSGWDDEQIRKAFEFLK